MMVVMTPSARLDRPVRAQQSHARGVRVGFGVALDGLDERRSRVGERPPGPQEVREVCGLTKGFATAADADTLAAQGRRTVGIRGHD